MRFSDTETGLKPSPSSDDLLVIKYADLFDSMGQKQAKQEAAEGSKPGLLRASSASATLTTLPKKGLFSLQAKTNG